MQTDEKLNTTEYDAARTGAVVIERSDRALVRVHGRDPLRMIQGLITNDLAGAAADRAVYAGILTPKGRLISELRAFRKDGEVVLEVPASALAALLEHFRKSVPPLFARFEDVTDRFAVIGVYGPNAIAVARAVDPALPESVGEDALVAVEGGFALGTAYTGEPGLEFVVPRDQATALRRRLIESGATAASLDVLDVLRIEAGQPRWGAELDETVIPLEAGLRGRMISETKGCYTGQEVIIRILHRGHVNRHLRGLKFGAPNVAPGTPLYNKAGKEIGKVTSSTWSPRHEQYIGLGYVRREVEPPATVRAGESGTAEVNALPF